jgi:hypothetical protein
VTDGNYRTLLRYGQRAGSNSASEPWTTIELLGLTTGSTYEFQIWVAENANTAQDKATVLGDGLGGAPEYGVDTHLFFEVVEGGTGQYAIGTFVANAPNQALNVKRFENLLSTPVGRTSAHWCNAWQLRETVVAPVLPSGTLMFIK